LRQSVSSGPQVVGVLADASMGVQGPEKWKRNRCVNQKEKQKDTFYDIHNFILEKILKKFKPYGMGPLAAGGKVIFYFFPVVPG
jgi:hypothetical protein